MAKRLEELAYAATLDPADCFDEYGMALPIRAMPEHVRRAIAGYEVDPVSFVTRIRFIDKLAAIMDYSKLAGDIPVIDPRKQLPSTLPRYDLSKLTNEEWELYQRIRQKALVRPEEAG
jgi:hypothetical protein